MRKFIFILFLSFSLFGATEFLINGDSITTVECSSKILVEGYLEGGDSIIDLITYVDLDSNGLIDPEDPIIRYVSAIDGSWSDIDEAKDGFVSGSTAVAPITGSFIYVAEDAGGTDQCIVHVKQSSSSYNISGQTTPDSAGFAVMVVPTPIGAPLTGDITDESGNYSINVPDSFSGRYLKGFVMSINEVLPNYLGTLSADSVLLSGNDTLNISVPQTDSSVFNLHLVDETGSTYTNPLSVQINGLYEDTIELHRAAKFGFAKDGYISMALHSSPYGKYGNSWNLEFSGDGNSADPFSMLPNDTSFQFDFPPDTVTDTITVFSCDAAIAGTVFVNGSPADGVEIWAESDSTGEAPEAGTYSDGHYRILVSSHENSYTVGLKQFDWFTYGGDKNVAPDSEGVNFYIDTSGIKEKNSSTALQNIQYLITGPTILKIPGIENSEERLKIYDVTGKLISTLSPKKNVGRTIEYKLSDKMLSPGIYFGKVDGKKKIIKLTVIR